MSLRTGPQTAPGGPPTAGASTSALQTDLGTMESAAQYVRETAESILFQLKQLHVNIQDLESSWQSPAATAFCNQVFPDWDKNAQNVHDGLYAIADGLTNSHKSYNQMEEDNVLGVQQAGQAVQTV